VRLINRSTRKLQLTPEGSAYYDRSIRILDDINTAEREAAIGAMPRGRVRVNTSVPFGLHWLLPLLPGFFRLHRHQRRCFAHRHRGRSDGGTRGHRHSRGTAARVASARAESSAKAAWWWSPHRAISRSTARRERQPTSPSTTCWASVFQADRRLAVSRRQ
jgi:DNA-binding transcriptional LysR family regulator